MTPSVILKPGREASVLRKHPWVFSGAIEQVVGDPAGGEILPVRDATGRFLAWGCFNRLSQITLRLLSWNGEERIDEGFWRARLARAIDGRCSLFPTHHCDESVEGSASLSGKGPVEQRTNAYRLDNAASDGLPGLIVDRYDEFLVAQFLTLGMEVRKAQLVELLAELVPGTTGIHERSDVEVREKEGLPSVVGPLHGASLPPEVIVTENGLQFVVDLVAGHKTGFYLDQRENRAILEQYASGEVLNCFAYTGAFAVYAARGGAGRITNVETSASALVLARRNLALNGFAGRHDEHIEADVFHELRRYRDAGRQFDVVLLDPPKFAPSRRAVKRAARGYKDINWLAMRLLRPGGCLFSFSCSAAISADLFQKILFGAALDAGRDVQIISRLAQGPDHPVLLSFPESAYLKGTICRVW